DGNVVADAVRIERINYPVSESQPDTVRFLEQASWGPSLAAVSQVQSVGMRTWLNLQFDPNLTPPSSYPLMPLLPNAPSQTCSNNSPPNCVRENYTMYLLKRRFYTNALYGPDQLRQRVAWALHKIMVVSGLEIPQAFYITPYLRL